MNKKVETLRMAILKWLSNLEMNLHERVILIQHLSLAINYHDFIACDVFVINKGFIINFVGAVIPFSIMLLQLMKK